MNAVPDPFFASDSGIQIDAAGRLVSLRSVPVETEPAKEPDPGPLLTAAGFDPATTKPVTPERLLFGGTSDTHLAWLGTLDGSPMRAEAYFWKGQVLAFRTAPPNERVYRVDPWIPPLGERVRMGVLMVASAAVMALLLILARRNLALGRGDRRGATRLAIATFVAQAGFMVFTFSYTPTRQAAWNLLDELHISLGTGVVAWFAYLAVEPGLRRRYPRLMVSWARLLLGGFRDPMVGKDVLVGILTGALVVTLRNTVAALPAWFDIPGLRPIEAGAKQLLRIDRLLGLTFDNAWFALYFTFVVAAVLLVGRLVLRRDSLAWLAPFSLLAILPLQGFNLPIEIAIGIVGASLYLGALRWGGLLSLTVAFFVYQVLGDSPVTLSPERWFSTTSTFTLGLVVLLAAIATRFSMGRGPIVSGESLD